VGALVQVLRLKLANGRWIFTNAANTKTDDQGRYRFEALDPDTYLVATGGSKDTGSKPMFFFPASFFPGAAQPVGLQDGEDRRDVDLRYLPVPLSAIRGHVIGPDGQPVTAPVELFFAETGSRHIESPTAQTIADDQGRFSFDRLPVGSYVLRILRLSAFDTNTTGVRAWDESPLPQPAQPLAPLPVAPTLWTEQQVTVTEGASNFVEAHLQRGFVVSGQAVFVGDSPKPTLQELALVPIHIRSADGRTVRPIALGPLESTGTFRTVGLPQGVYALGTFEPIPRWSVRSITVHGTEVSGRTFELTGDVSDAVITFTDRLSEISGVSIDRKGQPAPNLWIFAFPTDRKAEFGPFNIRHRISRSGLNGQFVIHDLLPGRYYLTSSDLALPVDWRAPEFLDSLVSNATVVTVGIGEKIVRNLAVR
jgi:hypothetical protein